MAGSRSIVVTGAAGGIGKALVERLQRSGVFVIAVARSRAQLADLESASVRTVAMDVSDTASVAEGYKEIDVALAGRNLDAVVHCAAIAPLGTVEFTPPEEYGRIINVNTLGALRILQGALPRLRGHGGRLILVSSLWGQVSGPLVGSYASSKHAIEAMADSVRREIAGSDVHISVVEPGVVTTKMLTGQSGEVSQKILGLSPEERGLYLNLYNAYIKLFEKSVKAAISADACAGAIENVLNAAKPKTRYRVGNDSKALCFLGNLLPDSWMDGIFKLMLKG